VEALNSIWNVLNIPLVSTKEANFSTWTLIYIAFLFTLVLYISRKTRRWLIKRFIQEDNENIGVWEATATITHYIVITIAIIIIFQTAGLDLGFLALFGGALGIGLGFGLQGITTNFVSGIIILFERPIKVGDRIDVGGITGRVMEISIRATTVVTNDNIAIIIPNSEFVSSRVTNWSHRDSVVRFQYSYGVAYCSDPETVKKTLIEAALEHDGVLSSPPPSVRFDKFGDSTLNFTLLVWTIKFSQLPGTLKSDLNFLVYEKFKEAGIKIPFPQRDVRVQMISDEVE